jgi:hypothetical protein
MPDSDESRGGWLWSFLGVAGMLIVCAAIGYYVWARIYVTRSLHRSDIIELTQTFKRWVEAGQPEGATLTEFMRGRRQDLVVSNRSFTIEGTNYLTQFAVTQPKSQRPGTLFVTTNEVLIWLAPNGQSELVPRN